MATLAAATETRLRCQQLGYDMDPLKPGAFGGYEITGVLNHTLRVKALLKAKQQL